MPAGPFPEKIVSGGQTGVDRAALDAALALGIPCAGWCPKGRRAEDGAIPERYPVAETESADYEERTRLNVGDADATLILASGPLSGGTGLTAETAEACAQLAARTDIRAISISGWTDALDPSGATGAACRRVLRALTGEGPTGD